MIVQKTTPLVTVVIPSYNSPDIFSSVLSVLEQDYSRIQLIVIDDGSSSFSKKDVEAYIRLHARANLESCLVSENEKNLGTVRTLNRALRQSQGKYIFNLAGDDCFYDDSVLSDWVDAFQKSGATVMTALRAVCDKDLKSCLKIEPSTSQIQKIRELAPTELFEEISVTNFILGCCTARTSECLHKYGLFDERYRLIEDHPMNLKLLRMGEPIVFFDRVVVKHRSGGTSSPAQYNTVYEDDVNRVMVLDSLPYTRHPARVRLQFHCWKRNHRLLWKRGKLFESEVLPYWAIQAWYFLNRPCYTLLNLPRLFTKLIKKGTTRL